MIYGLDELVHDSLHLTLWKLSMRYNSVEKVSPAAALSHHMKVLLILKNLIEPNNVRVIKPS
jgi:hypothetical protein